MADNNTPVGVPEKEEQPKSFSQSMLPDDKRELYLWMNDRIEDLKKTRQDHYGKNLDNIWKDADSDYVPHRLNTAGKKTLVENDETSGWRNTSSLVKLGSDDWQSDVSMSNPFVKIQAAISILIDQNPSGVFTPTMKKYQAATPLMKQLYDRSWRIAKSIYQLKLFVFNLAKYGWAVGRTYPRRIERKVKTLVEYNQEDPSKNKYEERTVVEYNDAYRENLDPRNTWVDDMARPNNPQSIRDWVYRKVYEYEDAEVEFGKYPFFKYVQKNEGSVGETIDESGKDNEKYKGKNLVEVYFYENRVKDVFYVKIGNVPVILEPLPVSDRSGAKKLTLWQAYWNIRHAESIYGISIYEAIRYDQALLDRIRNMTIDQLTLSIYKMFFYQGTQDLQGTGVLKLSPGVGKEVLDPQRINWLQVPGPGREALEAIKMFKNDIDETSGVTDPLLGNVTGKTAFELAQAKESALKRLKGPFDNILEALENEGYITLSIFQLIYSIPEIHEIADPRLVEDYMRDIGGDEDLYERQDQMDEQGNPVMDELGNTKQKFLAKVYPEFPLNLTSDEKGNLIETEDTQFLRIKPKLLEWEGIINIKAQSILTPSKQLDKALDIEMYNVLIPLISSIAQERIMASQMGESLQLDDLPHGKVSKSLIKLYDKDPRDILPDTWLKTQTSEPGQQPQQPGQPGQPGQDQGGLFIDQGGAQGGIQEQPIGDQSGLVPPGINEPGPNPTLPAQPQGVGQSIISKLASAFRR